jgi:hypothetical protein
VVSQEGLGLMELVNYLLEVLTVQVQLSHCYLAGIFPKPS